MCVDGGGRRAPRRGDICQCANGSQLKTAAGLTTGFQGWEPLCPRAPEAPGLIRRGRPVWARGGGGGGATDSGVRGRETAPPPSRRAGSAQGYCPPPPAPLSPNARGEELAQRPSPDSDCHQHHCHRIVIIWKRKLEGNPHCEGCWALGNRGVALREFAHAQAFSSEYCQCNFSSSDAPHNLPSSLAVLQGHSP